MYSLASERLNQLATRYLPLLRTVYYSALNVRNFLMSVCLYFSKAFDKVDHSILLKKLYRYGFRGHIHSCFKSYLEGRHQFVDISGCCSEKLQILQEFRKVGF